MPVAGQTIGKDVRLVIVTASGTLDIPPAAITSFDAQPETTNEKRIGMDGEARHIVTHAGWKGSFEVDRFNSLLEDFWAAAEASYYAGVNMPFGYIQETIQEPNGGITQYRYEKVVLDLKDLGKKEGDKTVKMKMDFMASRRIKNQ
ncbi:MAG: hypothetical protein A3I66_01425 [Burkholderiales bacterium RIFCSPLOWO2_02_FULL_57_36]|nr:MAG: hypothetical protein A3I66_01425 [Burkholderiales bacterium RIFCSPLOWO2_02_FULL_57_36]